MKSDQLMVVSIAIVLVMLGIGSTNNRVDGAVSEVTLKTISRINQKGPYLGIVAPNAYEMDPLIQSSSFVADLKVPYVDFAGRRFRIGKVGSKEVVIVMTGLSMVKGVLHYGIAGNANPKLQIGDVTIPQYWAHSGLWNWQRYGDGPNDELSLESSGDYTRDIGYLKFSNYNNGSKNGQPQENLLNNVWYQPEEVFPVNGVPEVRQHAFWVPVDESYFKLANKLKGLKFEACVNSTCLPRAPTLVRVKRGISANVFTDNRAYREFLHSKFNATPIDMESAAVALICYQQRTPFIAIRGLSDLAGGGSAVSNEADIFGSLAAQNSVDALLKFIDLLSS